MLEIKDKHISMTRGDTGFFNIRRRDKHTKEPIPFEDGDVVYFTVKLTDKTNKIELQKKITEFPDGVARISFDSSADTSHMACRRYVYDIQVNSKDGYVDTIVKTKEGSYTLTGEATHD